MVHQCVCFPLVGIVLANEFKMQTHEARTQFPVDQSVGEEEVEQDDDATRHGLLGTKWTWPSQFPLRWVRFIAGSSSSSGRREWLVGTLCIQSTSTSTTTPCLLKLIHPVEHSTWSSQPIQQTIIERLFGIGPNDYVGILYCLPLIPPIQPKYPFRRLLLPTLECNASN